LLLPDTPGITPLDYDRLLQVLLSADDDTPRPLVEAFYYIDELATADGMESLLAITELNRIDLNLGDCPTPADVAVEVWLRCRDLLEYKHGEGHLRRRRRFEYYQSGRQFKPAFEMPSPDQLADLAKILDRWFIDNRRGTGTRIFAYKRPDGFWFLVRHGEPFRREEAMQSAGTEIVMYRPVRYDVVVYQPNLGELQINARTRGEKDRYRTAFGHFLFGDWNLFPGEAKYTLEPLRDDGPASLVCTDIDGIEWVKLRAVHLYRGGNHFTLDIRRATDVFASLAEESAKLPAEPRIVAAVFQVKFSEAKIPRSVTIRPCNIAHFTRDGDAAVVENWLERRGFIVRPYGQREVTRGLLAST
jgi:hypothetical protein